MGLDTTLDSRQMPARLGYRPALDGLRAIAIGGVVAFHAGYAHAGDMGVTVFFALSGFLITTLLLEERAKAGTIDLRRFYLRRVFRLYPALVVALLATLAVTLVHIPPVDDHMPLAYTAALFYFANFVPIMAVPHALGSIVWTWSLSVEEQFYLVWPTVCRLVLRRRNPARPRTVLPRLRWLVAAAVVLTLVSVYLSAFVYSRHPGDPHEYFATTARMDALLIGCVAAMWRQRQLRRDGFILRTPGLVAALGLAGLLWIYVQPRDVLTWMDPVTAVLASLLILGVVERSRSVAARLLGSWPLVHIGRISYSVYLYNLLAIGLWGFIRHDRPSGWEVAGWLAITLVLAEASYWLVERPVLRLAPRFTARSEQRPVEQRPLERQPAVPPAYPADEPAPASLARVREQEEQAA